MINPVDQDAEKAETMVETSKIIADLEGLGAPPKVIGYFIALDTCYFRSLTGYVPGSMPDDGGKSVVGEAIDKATGQSKTKPTRNRGMSKTAEAITACLTPDGMSKRAIVAACGLTAKQVETALPTIQKNGYAHLKNSRWFAGPAPAKSAAGRPAGTTRTSAKKTGISLSDATLKAVQATSQQGADATFILNYLSREFGMTVRPNHLGISLQRHKRAGRLETRDENWYMPTVEELRQAS